MIAALNVGTLLAFYMADEGHILSVLAVNRVTARLVAFLDKVIP